MHYHIPDLTGINRVLNNWEDFHAFWRAKFGRFWGGQYPVVAGRILYDYAKAGPGEGYIVELGREYGGSTFILAAGTKSAHREQVISIDISTNPIINSHHFTMLDILHFSDTIISMVVSSSDASNVVNVPIRLLLIDADHHYESVKADIENYYPKVVDGGIILLHDILNKEYSWIRRHVTRAINDVIVDKYKQEYTIEEEWAVVKKHEEDSS